MGAHRRDTDYIYKSFNDGVNLSHEYCLERRNQKYSRGKVQTYFIASRDAIKIGKSHCPKERLAQFQVSYSYPLKLLIIFDGDHEKEFHRRFAFDRQQGEWFRLSQDILQFVVAAQNK